MLVGLGGCVTLARPPVSELPLQDEGAIYVYLAPLPYESRRLSFAVKALAAVGDGGQVAPLQVSLAADRAPRSRGGASGSSPPAGCRQDGTPASRSRPRTRSSSGTSSR